jgi:hypothetical protein
MESRKAAKSRHKFSFAVDRAEIDISSDWVQEVMQRTPPPPADPPAAVAPPTSEEALPRPSANNATVEDNATVEVSSTVESIATVEDDATVAIDSTVALFGGSYSATVANNATVNDPDAAGVTDNATVEVSATVEENATVADSATVEMPVAARRTFRLRPIQRITDGLTPGQYAVYSLMFEQGESAPGQGSRHFRGGYVDLVRLTGLSKRGIQNVVAELQTKLVITISQAPGYHKSQSTTYEVASEETVLRRWRAQGFQYAVGKSKDLVNIATVANNSTVAL